MEMGEARKSLLCLEEAKGLMLPESAGLCCSVSQSLEERSTHPETTESQRCFYQDPLLPAVLLEACHIYAGIRAFVYDFYVSLFYPAFKA